MKKKLMALFTILAAVAMLIPAGVRADSYKSFTKGADENFKIIDADSTDGHKAIIVEGNDSGSERYVKAFVYGFAYGVMGEVDGVDHSTYGTAAIALSTLKGKVNEYLQTAQEVYLKDAESADGYAIAMISKEEAEDIFFDGDQTTSALALVKAHLTGMGADSYDGFYTSTVEGDDVWAVMWNGGTTRLEKVGREDSGAVSIAYIPILEVDKTMACSTEPTGSDPEPSNPAQEGHCYICGDADPAWYMDGEVPEGCDITDIENPTECNPDTGVNDYILPITIAVCAAAIALTVITKQDLFKKI